MVATKSSQTLFQSLLLYGNPIVSLISLAACGIMLFWVSQLQTKIGHHEALLVKLGQFAGNTPSDNHVKVWRRHSRTVDTSSAPIAESFEYFLEKMAASQLQSLRASCLKNENVCIQGPKGNAGSKGLKGDPGIGGAKGSQGLRGDKGEKGEPGNWTSSLVAPQFIVIPPKTFEASVGQTAALKCYADGYPRPKITWSRTGSFKETIITSNGTWVIQRVEMQDFGQYHCTATNSLGSITHTFRLSPTGGTVTVSKKLVAGRNVSLPCSLCSDRGYSLKWKKEGDRFESDRFQIDGCVLKITNATTEDSDNYTCIAIREYDGEILTETTFLTIRNSSDRTHVSVQPKAVDKPCPGVTVDYNNDAVLKCVLCRLRVPGFSFTWERIGGKIAEDRAFTKDCTLIISKVTLQDAGNYTCVGRSKSFTVLKEIKRLCVNAPAQITSHFPKFVTVRAGQSMELQCDAVGPPVPEIYWTKGSVRLSGNETGILTITNASRQDNGEYYCHAINYLGKQVKKTDLVVTKLEFRIRPPAAVFASVSQTVSINCTSSIAPDFPLAYAKWVVETPLCGQMSVKYDVLPNGTLIISQTTLKDTGVYTCKAYTPYETISASVYLYVTPDNPRDHWMLIADNCDGFRQSTYNSSVYYAVSSSNVWDKSKYYHCPGGYHWACTEEGQRIFGDNDNYWGTYVYFSQCGWSSYYFRGLKRYHFRFRDSATTYAYKHAGNYDEYRVETTSDTSNFAGIVCIKD